MLIPPPSAITERCCGVSVGSTVARVGNCHSWRRDQCVRTDHTLCAAAAHRNQDQQPLPLHSLLTWCCIHAAHVGSRPVTHRSLYNDIRIPEMRSLASSLLSHTRMPTNAPIPSLAKCPGVCRPSTTQRLHHWCMQRLCKKHDLLQGSQALRKP